MCVCVCVCCVCVTRGSGIKKKFFLFHYPLVSQMWVWLRVWVVGGGGGVAVDRQHRPHPVFLAPFFMEGGGVVKLSRSWSKCGLRLQGVVYEDGWTGKDSEWCRPGVARPGPGNSKPLVIREAYVIAARIAATAMHVACHSVKTILTCRRDEAWWHAGCAHAACSSHGIKAAFCLSNVELLVELFALLIPQKSWSVWTSQLRPAAWDTRILTRSSHRSPWSPRCGCPSAHSMREIPLTVQSGHTRKPLASSHEYFRWCSR